VEVVGVTDVGSLQDPFPRAGDSGPAHCLDALATADRKPAGFVMPDGFARDATACVDRSVGFPLHPYNHYNVYYVYYLRKLAHPQLPLMGIKAARAPIPTIDAPHVHQ
jgi:hypothetical protein